MKTLARMLMMTLCTLSLNAVAQEMNAPGMKDMMVAKKMMMDEQMMMPARMEMMGEKSMMPEMVAKEMAMLQMMRVKEIMAAMTKATMTQSEEMKMTAEKMRMAAGKMSQNEAAVQKLFQEILARYIAAKKMETMAAALSAGKIAMPNQEMMIDAKMMMESKKEMMMSDASPAMMARESLIHALMQDKDVMAMVEEEAKMQEEPVMAKMMSDEVMMMKAQTIANDPAMTKGMVQGAMMRRMATEPVMMH